MRDSPGGSGVAGATWALLVAAGAGERLGIDRPKAFAPLAGRPLLAESLDRLDRCPWVDAIVVAAAPGWEEPSILLSEELAATKVVACVTGGTTRAESVRVALAEVTEDALVDPRARCRAAAPRRRRRRACARPACPRATGRCACALDPRHGEACRGPRRRRDRVAGRPRGVQTPQAFLAPALRRAYAGELGDVTDCASLVERGGGRVSVVDGDRRLLKVTTPEDLALVELLLSAS